MDQQLFLPIYFPLVAPTSTPSPASVNEDDILGLIIITVVCCAVGTSIVWVVIIYQTRRRLNAVAQARNAQSSTAVTAPVPDTQTHLYLETSSQHSKDSGTGDSTNPSSDQLQLCLPGTYKCLFSFLFSLVSFFSMLNLRNPNVSEEIVTCSMNNEEETGAVNVGAPLLRYTNHERQVRENEDCAV